MTLKQYLSQAIKLDGAIESAYRHTEYLERLYASSESVLCPESRKVNPRRVLEKLESAKEKALKLVDEYCDLQNAISDLIDKLQDLEERAVLERHFLSGQNWGTVSEEMNICLRTVHNIRGKALNNLEPIYSKMSVLQAQPSII